MIPVYAGNYSCFEQYRIQPSKCWPWFDPNPAVRKAFWKLSRKSITLACFNMLVLVPLLVAVKIYVQTILLENDKSFFFQTDDAHWPSTAQNLTDILQMVLAHELGFYATHRMMHTYPWLYHYHKVHHEYKVNTALAAQHNHPIDHIICIGTPAVIAILLVPSAHSISQGLFMVWGMWANLDDHVGYAFPWSPVRWFVGSSSTDEHEFHHAINQGCYSTKLSCYNRLLGGYEHYDAYCREQQLMHGEESQPQEPRTESAAKKME